MSEPHKRRVRYSGKHPKKFDQKYKELNPEKYGEDIEKIKARGQTPAGMHIPICVKEIIKCLELKPGMIGLDCTLGYGGHTTEMLKKITPNGKLTSLDVDSKEFPKTVARIRELGFDENVFNPQKMNFAGIKKLVAQQGHGFDFILADLGVSSMQIDSPERGFSFKVDSPLDLRLNMDRGLPAFKVLEKMSSEKLQKILFEYSDEPLCEILSVEISSLAKAEKLKTTKDLRGIVESIVSKQKGFANLKKEEQQSLVRKTCQRVFQAIRIHINEEFIVLDRLLESIPDCLVEGGKVAFLTFHSGEDRRVKLAFKNGFKQGIYTDFLRNPVRATFEEKRENPRASSAKLRWATKV